MAHDPVVARDDPAAGQPRALLRPRRSGGTGRRRPGPVPRGCQQAAQCVADPVRRRRLGRFRLLRRRGGRRGTDPQHRRAGPARDAPHLLLLRAVLHTLEGFADDRPTAHAPRPAPSAHVRAAGRVGRRGHPGRAVVRSGVRHPGGRQVAHGRERAVPTTTRRVRRLLRIPLRLRHVHRVAGPQLLPRDRLQRGAHPVGGEPPVQQVLRPCRAGRRDRKRRRGHHPGPVPAGRQVGGVLAGVHPADGRAVRRGTPPVVPLPLHPGRPFRQLPPRAVSGLLPGEAPVQGHDHRARRHRRPPGGRARVHRPDGGHARVHLVRQRSRRWRRGPTPPTRRSAVPKGRPGRGASGYRPSSAGPG